MSNRYVVRCDMPDGGNVIEGRAAPVTTEHADFGSAVRRWSAWHRKGPNGHVRDADIYRDGKLIGDIEQEAEMAGYSLRYQNNPTGSQRIVDAVPVDSEQ